MMMGEVNAASNSAYMKRCRMDVHNAGKLISDGTVYLSGTKGDFAFFFHMEALSDDGIAAVTSIRYTLQLYGCINGEMD